MKKKLVKKFTQSDFDAIKIISICKQISIEYNQPIREAISKKNQIKSKWIRIAAKQNQHIQQKQNNHKSTAAVCESTLDLYVFNILNHCLLCV